MDSNRFEKDQCSAEGMEMIPELSLENFKEHKENKRNIEDFIQFLEAIHYCEDPEDLMDYEIPFSLN